MPTLYVITDRYMWMTPVEGQPGRHQHNVALRGAQVDVSSAEAERGKALGALSEDPGDKVRAITEASEPVAFSDEQLRSSTVDDLVAYMGQRPSEAERVLELEDARERPRKGVTEAAMRIIEARDAELDRLARAEADEAEARAAEAAARTSPAGQ